MSEGRTGLDTPDAAAFEERPEVEEALLDDTTVSGLDAGTDDASDPQTPVFQEPGQSGH